MPGVGSPILDWGIEVILWLQQASPALDGVFRALTFFGDVAFYLVFFPLLYWGLDRRLGTCTGALFLASALLNGAVKMALAQPRPFDYDPSVIALAHAEGYGFPSGHTQNTVAVFGYLAYRLRCRFVTVLALILCLLVPLSRIYLGVHFPTDVLGGYLLGGLLLVGYQRAEPPLIDWFSRRSLIALASLSLGFPLLLLAVLPADSTVGRSAVVTLASLAIGLLIERRWIRFRDNGSVWMRCGRVSLGFAGVVLLYLLYTRGALIAPDEGDTLAFGLIAFWTMVGAPFVFCRLGLAFCGSEGCAGAVSRR